MRRPHHMRKLTCLALVMLALSVSSSSVAATDRIYWSAGFFFDNTIQRGNSDGSNIETIVTGLVNVEAMALDVQNGKVYWTDLNGRKIQRANLDGSSVEDLITGALEPFGIALDLENSKMYWTDFNNHALHRTNLDGSGDEELIGPIGLNFGSPRGIALDVDGGKMYWCITVDDNGKIQRANLDGSSVEELVTNLTGPLGIALDLDDGRMYWVDGGFLGQGKVQRAHLDGSNVEDVVVGQFQPRSIALDLGNGKTYWTDISSNIIQRADLDGSNVEIVLSALSPDALAIDISASLVVPFDAFAPKLEIDDDEFELQARFRVGAASDGIDPPTDNVSLEIGSFSTTIPAGAFERKKHGRFNFKGVVDGVELVAAVTPLRGGWFRFVAEGEDADLAGTANPVTVRLTIGDDEGSATVTAELD